MTGKESTMALQDPVHSDEIPDRAKHLLFWLARPPTGRRVWSKSFFFRVWKQLSNHSFTTHKQRTFCNWIPTFFFTTSRQFPTFLLYHIETPEDMPGGRKGSARGHSKGTPATPSTAGTISKATLKSAEFVEESSEEEIPKVVVKKAKVHAP
ncbi:hypothetical protein BDZ91DRAFT_758859 [Kalaharituber pfeilii]|nr:hypothetical protein BDZ91DRAFT_758859 [Kalaharituber pfeilii]